MYELSKLGSVIIAEYMHALCLLISDECLRTAIQKREVRCAACYALGTMVSPRDIAAAVDRGKLKMVVNANYDRHPDPFVILSLLLHVFAKLEPAELEKYVDDIVYWLDRRHVAELRDEAMYVLLKLEPFASIGYGNAIEMSVDAIRLAWLAWHALNLAL